MSLMNDWENIVVANNSDAAAQQKFWTNYYLVEQGIYEQLLDEPVEVVSGTVGELAGKYGVEPAIMAGFLDGINDSLKEKNPVDTMEEDTPVVIDIDLEKLYYNMVGAKADWLYNMEQWNTLIPEERRKELYKECKQSTTIVKGKKIGRNDPCPCGSGKKYKFCCGK